MILGHKSGQCHLRKYQSQSNYIEPTHEDDLTNEPKPENDESKSEHEEDDVDDQIHLTGDEVSEFLMIQRVMITPKSLVKDKWLRRSIFLTTDIGR